ncbi:MAG TPA: aldo/keto reductase [Candidatus Tetragenococcus pullicola]|nr:aldo/keto reductase [Candidatus Tetragenococcus pullicola]
MAILDEFFTLNNGVKIPKIGFGTWLIKDESVAQHVQEAAKIGYRHFDSAQGYGNERGVGEGMRKTGISRDDLFVTTKIKAEIKDYETAKQSIDESLQKLDLDFMDLLLIHAPRPWDDDHKGQHYFEGNLETWRAMEEAYKAGKIRAIGVSNFEKEDIENISKNSSIVPAVNQILTHIGHTSSDLIDYCKQKDILVEAYSPVAHGDMLRNDALDKMAKKYQVSIPQLAIRYCLEIGTLPLPKSENAKHIASNAAVDFDITKEDLQTLKDFPSLDS